MDHSSLLLAVTVCVALAFALVGIAGAILETKNNSLDNLLDVAAMFMPLSINVFVFGSGFVAHDIFGLPAYLGSMAGLLILVRLSFFIVPKIKRKLSEAHHKDK